MYSENNIKNIVKEIMRELSAKSVHVHENFVLYYVRLLSMDPTWNVDDENMSDREQIHRFVNYVVNVLEHPDQPNVVTLKIQFYFMCNFEKKDRLISDNRTDLLQRLSPLKHDIMEYQEEQNKIQVDKMYRKIVYYITLKSGLGNPLVESVYEEALLALKSILFENELKEFINSSKSFKEDQLSQLTKLVSGIRLFNKDCAKGGEEIGHLPTLLADYMSTIIRQTHSILVTVMDKVNELTTVIDMSYVYDPEKDAIVCKLHTDVYQEDIEYMKDALIAYRQYEVFIRSILDELYTLRRRVYKITEKLQRHLKELHETVYMRIAIPAYIVFPQFVNVSETWSDLQDQTYALAHINKVLANIHMYVKWIPYPSVKIFNVLGPQHALTDVERLEQSSMGSVLSSQYDNISVTNYQGKSALKYLGFCPYKLVQTEGALLPGNPALGVVKYQKNQYAFSDTNAAYAFMAKPKQIILGLLNLFRAKPHLIDFLGARDELMAVKHVKELVEKKLVSVTMKDVETETELHPVPQNIVPGYEWNIWDLKRKALKLADLSSRRTVSTQTDKQFSKCAIHTQTYELKEQIIQTKIDNYSNVPKPSTFIYGLRGRKDNKQFVIDLTRPVEE